MNKHKNTAGIVVGVITLCGGLLLHSMRKQGDYLINDNVEALASWEQIIVGALCGWSPNV